MEIIELNPVHAAIVDGICLMTVIDGVLDPEEYDFLNAMIGSMLQEAEDVVVALIENSLARLQNADTREFVDGIIARLVTPEHHHRLLVALQLASLTDGELHSTEVALLDLVVERLQLSDAAIAAAQEEAMTMYKEATALFEAQQ